MRETVLAFWRFLMLHKGTTTALLVNERIEKKSLGTKITAQTTDNASDITIGFSQIHAFLENSYHSSYSTLSFFHAQCFAHDITLAVK